MSDLLQPFLGALQASASVLLTISVGVIAAQFDLLDCDSAKCLSKFCVKLALPCLLIANVGKELDIETGYKYVPLLIWSVAYNVASIVLGIAITKGLKLPGWTTPALAFNNTTSLPLLLVQSLESTGVLDTLLMGPDDSAKDAVARAKSFFLINAVVSNALTFALGPRLLNGSEEDGEEKEENDEEEEEANENTSLLPDHVQHHGGKAVDRTHKHAKKHWKNMHPWLQKTLDFLYQFLNAPVIGAVIGMTIGLVKPLKKAFFAKPHQGGVFEAWLTTAIKNTGELFAALQVIVVGVKLASSLRKQKRGDESGDLPFAPLAIVTIMRHFVWPAISIPLIWALAKNGKLTNDPILWFSLMLLPTGPPAMKLTALADVNGSSNQEKLSIAKFLTVSYMISPLICLAVVGSLKASQAAMQ